ncbi:uncharacterized protein B0I36DRAFT_63652 [Microdochium trichocladiopsis]|uniref:Uncharacterized protein n=1 Tax=Microdochium trichocladiopsis TaxID=1682393 RepID=A0A9P9BRW1_9PEZI|nr:uncharacterized protein B0I36DRAFT_63652 [Microdochium trichocladiopsis]KAH7037270.1 hypothetical protein B0I36DRAFT_63652 [Microdochium trichocladiopsis]
MKPRPPGEKKQTRLGAQGHHRAVLPFSSLRKARPTVLRHGLTGAPGQLLRRRPATKARFEPIPYQPSSSSIACMQHMHACLPACTHSSPSHPPIDTPASTSRTAWPLVKERVQHRSCPAVCTSAPSRPAHHPDVSLPRAFSRLLYSISTTSIGDLYHRSACPRRSSGGQPASQLLIRPSPSAQHDQILPILVHKCGGICRSGSPPSLSTALHALLPFVCQNRCCTDTGTPGRAHTYSEVQPARRRPPPSPATQQPTTKP